MEVGIQAGLRSSVRAFKYLYFAVYLPGFWVLYGGAGKKH